MPQNPPVLRRSLGTVTVAIYGIGTIVGAGIFVLLGKLIGVAGHGAPLAFLLATLIALLTGMSYARLAGRLPLSAGEAIYVQDAFGRKWLTLLVGLGVAGSGVLSAATIAHGFAGYLNVLLPVPARLTAVMYILALGVIAMAGIRETAWVVGVIAIGSIVALIGVGTMVVVAGPDWHWPRVTIQLDQLSLLGVFLGAFVAFYALIGFEDLVNLAEEIEEPGPTLRVAIPVALMISAVLYVGLAIVALGSASVAQLARSDAPMAFLLDNAGLPGQKVIVVLSIVAITNGALAQLVMGSRVLYGLAREGLLPRVLSRIHPHTQTPLPATLVTMLAVGVAVSSGSILSLARGTSALILLVFTLVNLALIVMLLRGGGARWTMLVLPVLAAASCLGLLGIETMRVLGLLDIAQ